MTRAMLLDNNCDKILWPFAVETACYVRNRLPHASIAGKTPHEAFFGTKPDISHLRVFGSNVFAHNPNRVGKLTTKSTPAIFVGYATDASIDSLIQTIRSSHAQRESLFLVQLCSTSHQKHSMNQHVFWKLTTIVK